MHRRFSIVSSRLSLWLLPALAACFVSACGDSSGPRIVPVESIAIVNDCVVPDSATFTNARLSLDVPVYTPDGDTQLLDLARPLTGDNLPLVVLMHSGGWQIGHQHEYVHAIGQLAQLGYAAATVSYRLAPEFRFPAAVQDVQCAIRFLWAKSDSLGIDPSRTVLVGGSSGAHLAALVATSSAVTEFDDASCPFTGAPVSVDGVISYYGPFDLRRFTDFPPIIQGAIVDFLGGTPEEIPEVAALASPITHVDAGDPPFLILQGLADGLVPITQAHSMRDTLEAAGVPVTLIELPGQDHGFPLFDSRPSLLTASCTALAFLQKYLKP